MGGFRQSRPHQLGSGGAHRLQIFLTVVIFHPLCGYFPIRNDNFSTEPLFRQRLHSKLVPSQDILPSVGRCRRMSCGLVFYNLMLFLTTDFVDNSEQILLRNVSTWRVLASNRKPIEEILYEEQEEIYLVRPPKTNIGLFAFYLMALWLSSSLLHHKNDILSKRKFRK